jgi:hypothetical protein
VVLGTNGSVGPQVVTQDFGNPGIIRYITGVVYEDLNGNNVYDIGEGRGGVRVDVDGSAYYAISATSGGYSIPVSADGTYAVAFSGGGFASYSTIANVLNGQNVKVDYLVMPALLPGDYNADGIVDTADYVAWRKNDGTSDGYQIWRANFGSALGSGGSYRFADGTTMVPEPASFMTLATAIIGMFLRRRRCNADAA